MKSSSRLSEVVKSLDQGKNKTTDWLIGLYYCNFNSIFPLSSQLRLLGGDSGRMRLFAELMELCSSLPAAAPL